jgi:CRP-like cAMP-binding protein
MIWYALRRNGIRIPFPIQDVNLRQVDDVKEKEEQLAWIEKSLRRIPVLKPLSDDDVKKLALGVDVQLYGTGEEIVVQGDVGDSMYLIQTGTCDVVVEKPGTYSQRVATLKGGNFFGEMSLLTGERRTATVRAQEDSMLISIGKQAFQEMLESHPEISQGLAEALARRQAELDQMAKEKAVVERNARTFLERIKNVFGLAT